MRKMKNMLILAVMIFSLWITTGLSLSAEETKPTSGNPDNRLEEILQRGKLIVATSPDFAPQEFIDDSKKGQAQYVGSDIMMAQYIADQLGVELEIQAMDFAMVLSSVDLGESDMAISGFGWKEDREISFELSDGFNKTGEAACQGLLIRRADAEQFPTLESFDGKLIVAQAGSLQENYVQTQLPQAERVVQDDWLMPRRDAWVQALEQLILSRPEPVVIAAHSLGCILTAWWAAHSPLARSKVRAALLVAPGDVEQADLQQHLPGWSPVALQALPFPSVLVGSHDDPYCSLARAQQLAQAWGSQWVDAGAAGHINTATGLGDWDAGHALLQNLMKDN